MRSDEEMFNEEMENNNGGGNKYVTVRLTEQEYDNLVEVATEKGKIVNLVARDLMLESLNKQLGPEGEKIRQRKQLLKEVRRVGRK
jgi:hypothetical protein